MAHTTHKREKTPAHPAPGVPQLLNKLAENTAEFKNTEAAILSAIVQSSDDAIIGKTLDGTIMAWNAAAQKIFGYTAEEAIGQHISILIPEDRKHEDKLFWEKLKNGERIEGYETIRKRKDGSLVEMSLSISPVRTEDGTIFGSASIAHDITRRKQAQSILEKEERVQALLKQMEEQKAALEHSNQELQRFAYVAAHDLKEPLRTIISYTNLLAEECKGNLSEEAKESMHFIIDAGKRMQMLISDLLTYSRVETQSRPFVQVNCDELLDITLSNLRTDVDESGAQVCREDLPVIFADPTQMEQLFLNLLSNALKFRGDRRPKINVTATPDGDNWLFCVKDNGIGLDMKYADRIFEMFQRLHSIGEYPGTGIGLAVCKKIVDKHKGQIWVESELGKGTSFYFSLPAKPPPEPEDVIAAIAKS